METMSQHVQRPTDRAFLELTHTPSKDSPPSSRMSSLRNSTGELTGSSLREHRRSDGASPTTSDFGENGFLILTAAGKLGVEDLGLQKIEEEAVE
jgi:hypothetical protein